MLAVGYAVRRACQAGCLALLPLLAACGGGGGGGGSGTGTPHPPPGAIALGLQQISVSLSFPVFATAPNDGTGRLFIVEKNGVIRILNLATQQLLPVPFLDLTGQIATGGEQGLLGLAFHPNFSLNGFFYVNVINLSGDTEIRRYRVSFTDPNVADTASVLLIISIDQPAGRTNHKAGWLGFGQDGFLYAALGDGGGVGDPDGNAQNLNSLLGKMLRLDVDRDAFADATRNYAIPLDNPFAGAIPGLDEVWAYGLRNPWRPSFDRGTGDFYIADVGQNRLEEVNVSTRASGGGSGLNFGWDIMEGNLCFEPMANCNMVGLTRPLLEYDHAQGCSITGGYVYQGTAMPALQGTYFYGDFCAGFVRSFKLSADGSSATEQTSWPMLNPGGMITSFGEDSAGELYIMTSGGGLYRIVPN